MGVYKKIKKRLLSASTATTAAGGVLCMVVFGASIIFTNPSLAQNIAKILSDGNQVTRTYNGQSSVILNIIPSQLGVQVAKIAVAPRHICVLLTNSKVYCAGSNAAGQIGQTNYSSNFSKPIDISPYPNNETVADVAVGFDDGANTNNEQTCVLTNSYRIYCTGNNSKGNFGNSANLTQNGLFVPTSGNSAFGGTSPKTAKASPTFVNGSYNQNMCTIADDDYAWCAGLNDVGQLGDGSSTDRNTPQRFDGMPTVNGNQQKALKVIQVPSDSWVTNNTICVLTDAGRVYCHGSNARGQVGVGNTSTPLNSSTPTQAYTAGAAGSAGQIVDFGAGHRKTCALYASGALYCAGAVPYYVAFQEVTTPERFGGTASPKQFTNFSMGPTSICAVEAVTKDVYCVSDNAYGQLGTNNTTANRNIAAPTKIAGVGSYNPTDTTLKLANVYVGDAKICLHYNVAGAEDTTGFMTCAGRNNNGQLGIGNTTDKRVFGGTNGAYIMPSGVFVKKAFVNQGNGLVNGTRDANITEADTSGAFNQTCVLGTDGNAYCAGYNANGQLGNLTTSNQPTPVKFILPSNP